MDSNDPEAVTQAIAALPSDSRVLEISGKMSSKSGSILANLS